MSDEYKKLYASLEVLGSAIKKAEEHLRKSPAAHDVFIDITEAFHNFYPIGEDEAGDRFTLRLGCGEMECVGLDGKLFVFQVGQDIESYEFGLTDLPSEQKIAFAKYIPELIRLADRKVLELAAQAEDYAGGIEQALAAAAKKPERKPKKKA